MNADGAAPAAGTPVTIRFVVERLSLAADFGALVERQFGAGGSRVMLRYDRVPKQRLDRIFSVAAASNSERGEGRPAAPERAGGV